MVVVFFNEKIVIFLDNQVLVSDDFGLLDFFQKFVIGIGSFLNESQFSRVAMSHPSIQFSLQQECNHKPINCNKTVSFAFDEKHNDSDDDSEGHLKNQVHVPEQCKNQFKIHVLQVDNFTLWNSVSTLTRYSQ